MGSRLTPALLICLLVPGWSAIAARPIPAQATDTPAPSVVERPVRISLAPLFEAAERGVPQQAGHWHTWRKTRGVNTRYRAWRGPLGFRMTGNTLQVEAHVRYQVMAQKTLLGALTVKSSCGVDEAPRQAIIGVRLRLGWGPDWVLRPNVQIMPTRFLDRCEMTIANIDVTPLVEREFRKQLQDKLRTALRKLAPGVNAIRQQAAHNWELLQQPVALAHDHWLLLRPAGIALSPLTGRGNTLETRLAMLLHPTLVSGTRPASGNRPLPPPALHYPRAGGLDLRLAVAIDYEKLGAQMATALAQEPVMLGGRKPDIGALQVTGAGEQIQVLAELTGASSGRLQLTARLVFEPTTRKLQLNDLEYTLETDDPFLEAQANLFHGPLRQLLEATVNQRLQQLLDNLQLRLARVLEALTPAGMTLDLSALQLQAVRIALEQAGVQLHATVSGYAALDWRQPHR